MNTKNSKTNEQHKFVLNLPQRLDLKSKDKYIALQNLYIYYTWKIYKNSINTANSNIIASTWNDESELPYGSYSVSDIPDYLQYIIKKH